MRDGRLRRRTVRDQPYTDTHTYTDTGTYADANTAGGRNLPVRKVTGFVYTIRWQRETVCHQHRHRDNFQCRYQYCS